MPKFRQAAVFDPRRAAGLFSTLSYTYVDGHVIAPHFHEEDQVVYGVAGVMAVTTAEGLWIVPPNRAVWVPAGIVHSIAIWGSLVMQTLYTRPGAITRLGADCCLLNVSSLLRELLVALCALPGPGVSNPSEGSSESLRLFAVVLDRLTVAPSGPLQVQMPVDHRAVRVANLVIADPASDRRLKALCEQAGASERTIERLFRSETGVSFGRWRRQVCLAYAVRLLADGGPVGSVALDVGYHGASAFIAAFRTAFGTTPARYLAP